MESKVKLERMLEAGIFRSRWLLAPIYVGLIFALIILLISFVRDIVELIPKVMTLDPEEMILSVLTMIDLSLTGNLVIIVIFSGYENFVSKINTGDHEDRPSWMGTLDFSGLKMKLIGSIIAISVISLLRAFMTLTQPDSVLDVPKLTWLLILHLAFLVSGVMFALMDLIAAKTEDEAQRLSHKGPASP